MRGSASSLTRATRSAGGSTLVHSILGCRMSATSSVAAASSSRIPLCATSSPFTISGSVSSSAPPSTMTIESAEPDTTMSTSENSSCWNVGFKIQAPSTRPTRTAAMGPFQGTLDISSAAEAAVPFQEAPGNLAGGIGLLAILDGEGEEGEGRNVVRHGHGREDHRLPELQQAGSCRLLGEPPGLKLEGALRKISFDVLHHIACLEHHRIRQAPRCSGRDAVRDASCISGGDP